MLVMTLAPWLLAAAAATTARRKGVRIMGFLSGDPRTPQVAFRGG